MTDRHLSNLVSASQLPSRSRRAFALVEIVVVLAILGIIWAVAAPVVFRNAPRDELASSVQQVRLMFQLAQKAALIEGCTVILTIDPQSRRYWISRPSDDSLAAQLRVPVAPRSSALEVSTDSLRIPLGIDIAPSVERIKFVFFTTGSVLGGSLTLQTNAETRIVYPDDWGANSSPQSAGK